MEETTSWYLIGALYLIVGITIAVYLYFGFTKRWHRFRETTSTHLVWSPLVPWYVLLAFRLGAAVVALIVIVLAMLTIDGSFYVFFEYYAVWNTILMILYFLFLAGIQIVHDKFGISDSAVLYVGNSAVCFFNTLTAAANLSAVLGIIVLLPLQYTAKTGVLTLPAYSFTLSVFTAVVMFIEFLLNNVPVTPFLVNLMAIWAIVYSYFVWIIYFVTDTWVYAFMNVTNNWAVLAYFAIFLAHVGFFYITYGLWRVKQKLLRKFKPGFDVTFEVGTNLNDSIADYASDTTSLLPENLRTLQRYVSRDEEYYSDFHPVSDRMDF